MSMAHTPRVTTGSFGGGRDTLVWLWTFVGLAGTEGVVDEADELVVPVPLALALALAVVLPLPLPAAPLAQAGEREDIVGVG